MNFHYLRLVVLLVFISVTTLGAHVWNALTQPTIPAEHVIAFTIDKGDSFSRITDKLIHLSLIHISEPTRPY